jgi:hypothetical protein
LSAEDATQLLRRQDALQAQARRVIADLDLFDVLRGAGEPQQIGSSVTGLMVWRDIDVNVVAPGCAVAHALATMRPLFTHPRVTQVRYLNESGAFNQTGLPRDERYYFALYYRPDARSPDAGQSDAIAEWKIDISFWLQEVARDEPAQIASLARQLTDETRLAILWIKSEWYRLPTYRRAVSSMDIYDAVLQHGARTPTAFDAYLHARGKPGR